jgi:hypothetical protein
MKPAEAFRLSRVEAEGWNAARRVPLALLTQMNKSKITALNPYAHDPEQTRWNAGFANALASWHRQDAKAGNAHSPSKERVTS